MTQTANWSVPLIGPATPATMAQRIDDSFQSMLTQNRGATRPSYAQPGMMWIDAANNAAWKVNLWDGADDNTLMTLNSLTGALTLPLASIGDATSDAHVLNRISGDNRYLMKSGGIVTGSSTFSGSAAFTGSFNVNTATITLQSSTNIAMIGRTIMTGDGVGVDCLRLNRTGTTAPFTLAFLQSAGVTVGSISYNGTNTLYNATSDRRVKKNIQPLVDVGRIFDEGQPVTYDSVYGDESSPKGYSFIAQDFHEILPGAVTIGSPEGVPIDDPDFMPWMMNTQPIVIAMFAEIKSLRARLAAAGL